MRRPGLLAALGLLFADARGVIGQPGDLACESDHFIVNQKCYKELDLLYRYAPEYLQYVEFQEPAGDGRWYHDFFTSIGFDEVDKPVKQWNGEDNWDNASKTEFREKLPTVVYGGVVAVTTHQVYLVYYVFHAGDYADGFTSWGPLGFVENWFPKSWTEHENDLEGGLVTIDHSSGSVIHAYALYHNFFDDRHLEKDLHEDKMSVIAPEGHAHVWVEGGGHGQRLFGSDDPANDTDNNRGHFVRYQASEKSAAVVGETRFVQLRSKLEQGTSWKEITAHPYRIELLWPIFEAMYRDNSEELDPSAKPFSKPFEGEIKILSLLDTLKPAPGGAVVHRGYLATTTNMYQALRGSKHGVDKAHFPWGQGEFDSYVRFLDPVQTVLKFGHKRHPHDPISCTYLNNPYLNWLLNGKIQDLATRRRFADRCAESDRAASRKGRLRTSS